MHTLIQNKNKLFCRLQYTLFYCALFYYASQVLCYLQIEGKTPHQQKDYDLLFVCSRNKVCL